MIPAFEPWFSIALALGLLLTPPRRWLYVGPVAIALAYFLQLPGWIVIVGVAQTFYGVIKALKE